MSFEPVAVTSYDVLSSIEDMLKHEDELQQAIGMMIDLEKSYNIISPPDNPYLRFERLKDCIERIEQELM